MNILDWFQGKPQEQQQPAQPAQQDPAAQQAQADAATGTPAAFSGNAQQQPPSDAPLASFSDLWKIDPATAAKPDGPLFQLDPVKLQEQIKGMEFAPNITPEHLQKIMQGDAGTLQQVLNVSAQNNFAKMMEVVQKMVTHGADTTRLRVESTMADKFKNFQVGETLSSNPLFNNPAIKPMVDSLTQQFQLKYPQSSAAQVSKMAEDFISQLGSAVAPNQSKPAQQGAPSYAPTSRAEEFQDFF